MAKPLSKKKSSSRKILKTRRRQNLAIVSAVIFLLTYSVREMIKEWAKDTSDTAQSAENLYRSELGQATISTQMLQIEGQMNAARAEAVKEAGEASNQQAGEVDYSDIIKSDLLLMQQASANLNSEMDSVSRLIGKVTFGAEDLRQQLNQIKPDIEKSNQRVAKAWKPSAKNNWVRSVDVKLVMVGTLIAELPVLMVGDRALTRIRWSEEIADRIYRFSRWVGYALYSLSILVALYAASSNPEGLEEPE